MDQIEYQAAKINTGNYWGAGMSTWHHQNTQLHLSASIEFARCTILLYDYLNPIFSVSHLWISHLCSVFTFVCAHRLNGCYKRCQVAENAKVWCPVCKQGELRDTHNLIYCTLCKLRLDLGEDKITLEFLRERLASAHTEHFDRGCKSAPKFCLQTMFGLTALYMQCEECSTFDIVV